ncbi:MAG: lysylphosphatidylglycerol synthase domain-containing protein [bacterium]
MFFKSNSVWKRLQPFLRFGIPAVLLFFIGRQVAKDWDKIINSFNSDAIWWALPAFLFFFLGVGTIAWNWKVLLEILGAQYSFTESFRSFYYSMLLKYMPGKIWGVTGRIVLAKRDGIPEGTNVLSIILESLFLMTSSSIIGLLVLSRLLLMPWEIQVLLLLSPSVLVFLHPKMIHRAVKILSRRFPDYVVPLEDVPKFGMILRLLMQYSFVWVFHGLGFWFLLKMLDPLGKEYILLSMGGNSLAWLVGFLAVFTPAGLGVRELILTRLSSGIVKAGPAAAAAVLSRVIIILCELIGSLILFFLKPQKDKGFSSEHT